MTNNEIKALATDFWQRSGRQESFPRSLEISLGWALPIAIIKISNLSLKKLYDWLRQKGISVTLEFSDRDLKACLIANKGRGFIFLDKNDNADEARFSLAHEIAHFLIDYLLPRERALAQLGESILEVFDGLRQPTAEERLVGVLRGVELGYFTHLITRSPNGLIDRPDTLDSEDRSDLLAIELLAPHNQVLDRLELRHIHWENHSAFHLCKSVLIEDFGLPEQVAENYSNTLIMKHKRDKSFREWLEQ